MGSRLEFVLSNVSGSENVEQNTTNIHIALDIITDFGTENKDHDTSGSITVNGTRVADLAGLEVNKNTRTNLWTGDVPVLHEPDGTGVANVSASFDVNTGTRWVYASASITMPTVPRASTVTCGAFTTGVEGRFTINRASSAFTHTLFVKFVDEQQIEIPVTDAADGSYADWAPPNALLEKIPESTGAEAHVFCTTYLNGTPIAGAERTDFMLYANGSVQPSISDVVVTPVNPSGSFWDQNSIFVKGFSKAKVRTTASGAYGSKLKTISVSGDIINRTEQIAGDIVSGNIDVVSGVLMSCGLENQGKYIEVSVKDSRQRNASPVGRRIDVYDYSTPVITASEAFRSDSAGNHSNTGSYVTVKLDANCSALNGNNVLSMSARWRKTNGNFGSPHPISNGVYHTFSAYDSTISYIVELTASDSLDNSKTVLITIPTEMVTLHLAKDGVGVSVGGYCTNGVHAFESFLPIAAHNTSINDKGITSDKFYRVNSEIGITNALNQIHESILDNSIKMFTIQVTSGGLTLGGGIWHLILIRTNATFCVVVAFQYGSTTGATIRVRSMFSGSWIPWKSVAEG